MTTFFVPPLRTAATIVAAFAVQFAFAQESARAQVESASSIDCTGFYAKANKLMGEYVFVPNPPDPSRKPSAGRLQEILDEYKAAKKRTSDWRTAELAKLDREITDSNREKWLEAYRKISDQWASRAMGDDANHEMRTQIYERDIAEWQQENQIYDKQKKLQDELTQQRAAAWQEAEDCSKRQQAERRERTITAETVEGFLDLLLAYEEVERTEKDSLRARLANTVKLTGQQQTTGVTETNQTPRSSKTRRTTRVTPQPVEGAAPTHDPTASAIIATGVGVAIGSAIRGGSKGSGGGGTPPGPQDHTHPPGTGGCSGGVCR